MNLVSEKINRNLIDSALSHGRHARPSPVALIRRGHRTLSMPYLAAIFIAAFAFVLRVEGIRRNYDIYIDEVTYTRIADNLANGHGLTLYGSAFDLHPPAALAFYALVIKILGLHGTLEMILFGIRPMVAVLGSVTCALVCILVGTLVNWRVGVAVGIIAALDPFEIFYDSRVMLEAPAQLASILAILLLARSFYSQTARRSWVLVGLSGIAGGCAMCAKEDFGLVLVLTLLLLLATGGRKRWRRTGAALAILSGCYLLSEALVVASTGFKPWWDQNSSGLRRLIGSKQVSGFNSSTVHVSLISRVAADATHFSSTYAILGIGSILGILQVVGVLRRRTNRLKAEEPADSGLLLVGLWSVAATAYLGYATLFGTIEEQMYYLLFIPALCTMMLEAARALPRLAVHWRTVLLALFAVIVFADSAVWTAVHRTTDNEYSQLLAWLPKHVPDGSTVAVTDYTAQFLLRGVVIGKWATIPALIEHHVSYVLLSTSLVDQGYGIARLPFRQYLQAHAIPVFQANGVSEGSLILYDVSKITGVGK